MNFMCSNYVVNVRAMQLNIIRSNILFCIIICISTPFIISCGKKTATIDTKPAQTYHYKNIPYFLTATKTSAEMKSDTLHLTLDIKNTSGRSMILLPSLVNISGNLNEKALAIHDNSISMAVPIFGLVHTAPPHFTIDEGHVDYCKEYLFQFISVEKDSSLFLEYIIPLKMINREEYSDFNFLEPLRIPAWSSNDSIFQTIGVKVIQTHHAVCKEIKLDLIDINGRVAYATINIGMAHWAYSTHVSQEEFDLLHYSKTWCMDSTTGGYITITKRR